MPTLIYTKHTSGKKINKTPGHAKAKAEHELFLKKMGISTTPRANKSKKLEYTPYVRTGVPTSDAICATSGKKENTYTGTLIKGIATMHKSNAVPVINKEQATEISNMRR